MTKALTVQEEKNIKSLLSNNMKAISSVLPKHLTPEKAARLAYIALVMNPALGRCSQGSLINCVIEASTLGVEIGGPLNQSSLIPFKGEAKLIVEYAGKILLAQNTGNVKNVSAYSVYEKDQFSYQLGLNPDIYHIPSNEIDPGKLIYAYAVINYVNGGQDFEVINERLAMEAKGRSAAGLKTSSPWNQKDLEYQMWKKTALHRLMNRVPKSAEKTGHASPDGIVPNYVEGFKVSGMDLDRPMIPENTPPNDIKKPEQKPETADELIEKTEKVVEKEKKQAMVMQETFPEDWQEACEACGVENDIDKMTAQECISVGAAMSSIQEDKRLL